MRKTIKYTALLLIIALFVGVSAAAAGAGTSSDPLITRSYLEGALRQSLLASGKAAVSSGLDEALGTETQKYTAASEAAASKLVKNPTGALADMIYNYISAGSSYSSKTYRRITLSSGDVITGKVGTTVVVSEGSARSGARELINLTDGGTVQSDTTLENRRAYMISELDNSSVTVTASSVVFVSGSYSVSGTSLVYLPQNADIAAVLKKLGLFAGSGSQGYNLTSEAGRAEGVVMLVRLLGKADAAASGTYQTPFTDLPDWAKPYVGSAYTDGLVAGTSATTFSPSGALTADQYVSFLLRALGYSDKSGDFTWNTAVDSAVRLGVYTAKEGTMLKSGTFYRDKMVYASYFALFTPMKDGSDMLLYKLIDSGAVDKTTAFDAASAIERSRN